MGFKLKSIGNAVKSVVGAVFDVAKGIATGEYIAKITGAVVKLVGNDVVDDILGLDKLGNEMSQVGSDIYQIGKVLGGEYHDAAKKVQEYGKKVEDAQKRYNAGVDNLVEKMESLVAFHEIFQLAMGNRLDNYMAEYGPVLEAMMAQYQAMVKQLKQDFDFVLGLTEGAFMQRLIGGIIMIIGGIMSDLGDIVSGKADGDTWKRAITAVILIIVIVFMWWNPVGWWAITAAILVTIGSIMALDGMYANGAITGAVMGMLDFLFNDVLNLDDLVGSDFDKFDKDHEDYQQMVMFTQLALALAGMAAGWASAPQATAQTAGVGSAGTMSLSTTAGAGGSALNSAAAGMTGQTVGTATASGASTASYLGGTLQVGNTMSQSSFLGVSFSTYSDIYKAFSTASDIKDVAAANDQYEKMKAKFQEDIDKLNTAIDNKYRKNFMKHYKDTAYFLQDQQEYIDRYVWGMTADSMYVDPYGTTPVANIRFTPDKDTRGTSFGFEDMFDESTAAGSRGYFNNIIYGN